jgi:hypothetical protein
MVSKKLRINQLHREQQESNFETQYSNSKFLNRQLPARPSLSTYYYMVRVASLVILLLLLL